MDLSVKYLDPPNWNFLGHDSMDYRTAGCSPTLALNSCIGFHKPFLVSALGLVLLPCVMQDLHTVLPREVGALSCVRKSSEQSYPDTGIETGFSCDSSTSLNKQKGLGKKCIEQRKVNRLPWNKTFHRNSLSAKFVGSGPSCAQESFLESLGLGKCQVLGMFCCFQAGAGSASALSSHGAFPLQTGVSCSGSAPCRQSANSSRRFAACVASPQQIPPPSSVPASLPWSHRDRSW